MAINTGYHRYDAFQLNPTLWLRADKGVNYTVDGGDLLVDIWEDQGSGNYNSSGTTTERPKLINNALNGKPVIRFSGSQRLANPNNIDMTTIFMVANHRGGATFTNYPAFIGRDTSYVSEIGYYLINGDSGNALLTNDSTYDGYYNNKRINGVVSYNFSPVATYKVITGIGRINLSTVVGFYIGFGRQSLSYLDGDIAEIMVFNSALSISNIISVEQYLKNKYAIV